MIFSVDLASTRMRLAGPEHLRWLRDAVGPVLPCTNPTGVLVLPAELVRTVLGDPVGYSATVMSGADRYLLGADGDRHRQARQALVRAVRGTAGPAFDAEIATGARRLVDRFVGDGGGDAVSRVARPLALVAAARVCGLPVQSVRELTPWAEAAVSAATAPSGPPATGVGPLSRAATSLLERAVAGPAQPAGTLLDGLTGAVPPHAAVEVAMLVLLAALDTTTALVAACLDHLATGAGTGEVVETVLLRRGPVRFVRRVATAGHRLGGVPVPAGATVVAHLGSAGYHFAFGAGPHACPGAAIARTVARAAVTAAQRAAVLRPAGPPVPGRSAQIDSYAALPLSAGGTDG